MHDESQVDPTVLSLVRLAVLLYDRPVFAISGHAEEVLVLVVAQLRGHPARSIKSPEGVDRPSGRKIPVELVRSVAVGMALDEKRLKAQVLEQIVPTRKAAAVGWHNRVARQHVVQSLRQLPDRPH